MDTRWRWSVLDVRMKGLLIISHGSRDEAWVTLVDEAIDKAVWPEGLPVASSFLECVPNRSIQDGIDELESQGVEQIGVVPLFVSSGSTHVDEIAWALGVKEEPLCDSDLERFRVHADIVYGAPLDEDDSVYAMVAARLRALDVDGKRDAVMLIAHGSPHEPFQTRWRDGLTRMAHELKARNWCVVAGHALLCCDDVGGRVQEMQSLLSAGREHTAGGRVAVVPIFLSQGYFTTKVIPERLSAVMPKSAPVRQDFLSSALEIESQNGNAELEADECALLYDGQTLLPHPALTAWLEQEARRVLSSS
ncbi:CbiX/SirB N-terminal domain-containing protein [Paenibacillus sp. UMB4589-SE434]|nr:CbiX/SirB N-terminal domain-containing protein [Paenibacillus sp. UMB4589-SE434]